MSTAPAELTLDEVRDRIRVAGLPIPEERLALIHSLLRHALRPIRALDTRAALTLEPAPTFDPPAPPNPHRRRRALRSRDRRARAAAPGSRAGSRGRGG